MERGAGSSNYPTTLSSQFLSVPVKIIPLMILEGFLALKRC